MICLAQDAVALSTDTDQGVIIIFCVILRLSTSQKAKLMKLLFDFFPILLFFLTYKFMGIYSATAIAIIASILQVGFYRLKYQRFEKMHLISLVIIVVLGGATL